MKKRFYLGALMLCSILSVKAQTYLDEDDCESLKDVYVEYNDKTSNPWEYDYNGSTDVDFSNCNCDANASPVDLPLASEAEAFAGVTISGTYISELDMRGLLSGIPSDLFIGNLNGFQNLIKLKLSGIGGSTTPTIDEDALPLLEELEWRSELNMTTIPDLSIQSGSPDWYPLPALKALRIYFWDDLNSYFTSNVDKIGDRPNLETISLIDLDFSGSTKPVFDPIFESSISTLKNFVVQDVFTGFGTAGTNSWHNGELTSNGTWSELVDFSVSGTGSDFDQWFLEGSSTDNPGAVFNSTYFPKLVSLRVENCGFKGSIPEDAFDISSLRFLYINNNNLTGDILPSSLSSNIDLTHYLAQKNDFSQSTDAAMEDQLGRFEYLHKLQSLYVSECGLHCDIDYLDLEAAEDELRYLEIDKNDFTGTLEDYYENMPLDRFSCSYNMLTHLPKLRSGLQSLNVSHNYFDLEDIYRATKASECDLAQADANGNNNYQIDGQHQQDGGAVTVIDLSGRIDPSDADIRLSAANGFNFITTDPDLTGAEIHYQWKRDDGTNQHSADGSTVNSAIYKWEVTDPGTNSGHSGDIWYCEMFIKDHSLSGSCAASPASGFYSELVMEVEHTKVTFVDGDECNYNNPNSSGSVPHSENEDPDPKKGSGEERGLIEDFGHEETMEILKDISPSLFPNPSSGSISIVSNDLIKDVVVMDINGQEVAARQYNSPAVDFNVHNFKNGLYLIKITTENGQFVKQFVKE